MALKENLNAVKDELSAEEQFLESVIKGERIFKKYKYPIIGGVAILIALGVGYAGMSVVKEKNLKEANEAYVKLLENPKDAALSAILKEKNPKLYQTYRFQIAIKNSNLAELESIIKEENLDSLLRDLANYQLGKSDSNVAKGLAQLIEGFQLMKAGKQEEAKLKFALIPMNSALQNIVKNLEHYQGK